MKLTDKQVAQKCAARMQLQDTASKWTGIVLEDVDAGTAVVSLEVASNHSNGEGICHGGVIYMLADCAFAYACNSRNKIAFAQHNSISYHVPGQLGDRLIATAQEVTVSGRSGLYDVAVRNQDGVLVASFRGASRIMPGEHFSVEDT